MDGYMSAGIAGILYAEDFGEPPPQQPHPEPAMRAALGQADIDAACIRAVQSAERAWAEGADERRTRALETLNAGLAEARAAAAAEAEAAADGVARAMLGMVSAVLPDLCRAHGDAEVRALLRRLLPVVGQKGAVVVRVHAGLLPDLAADLERLDDGLADTIELRAANLAVGDVRLAWEDGGLLRDTATIRAAVNDCLSQLGLTQPPATIPEPRSLAHVHAQ